MEAPYIYPRPIRWGDLDPALIVYTANYFDFCMEALEGWCINTLGFTWADIISKMQIGMPFVHAGIDFHAPSVSGDSLNIMVMVKHLGKSSVSFEVNGYRVADDQEIFTGNFVCCFTDLNTFKPVSAPADMRKRINLYQERTRLHFSSLMETIDDETSRNKPYSAKSSLEEPC